MGKKKKDEQKDAPGGGDCKVATVEVEASGANNGGGGASGGGDTATLPVTRPLNPQGGEPAQDNAEKNNAANKEMELKNVRSTPAKK